MIFITKTAKNLLQYWRSCLIDGYRTPKVLSSSIGEIAVEVLWGDLLGGVLNTDKTKEIFEKYYKADNPNNEKPIEKEEIAVLICPFRYSPKFIHGKKEPGEELIPLWIPAKINLDGKIQPIKDDLPWITRDLLEPTLNEMTI